MNDPRWGQEGREGKADLLLSTLRAVCGSEVVGGFWLDVGCGNGGVAAQLAVHVARIAGVDPEPWDGWRAFREAHSNLELHAGCYRDLTGLFGAGSVDVVVCNQVYEHVDDPMALLSSIYDVLKPGGACYFAGPNLLWPIEPHVFWPFVHWFPRGFAQRVMRVSGSRKALELDAWSWSYWALVSAFARTGFLVENGISARLRAGAESASAGWMLRLAARTPRFAVAALTPVAPGFVFVLHKPPHGGNDRRVGGIGVGARAGSCGLRRTMRTSS